MYTCVGYNASSTEPLKYNYHRDNSSLADGINGGWSASDMAIGFFNSFMGKLIFDIIKHIDQPYSRSFINSKSKSIYNNLQSISTLFTELEILSKLDDNWDSYNAPKPNQLSINNVEHLLSSFIEENYPPHSILPSVEGGISLIFKNNELYVEIECDNDGDIIACYSNRKDEPLIWDIETGEENILQTIQKIRSLLEN